NRGDGPAARRHRADAYRGGGAWRRGRETHRWRARDSFVHPRSRPAATAPNSEPPSSRQDRRRRRRLLFRLLSEILLWGKRVNACPTLGVDLLLGTERHHHRSALRSACIV